MSSACRPPCRPPRCVTRSAFPARRSFRWPHLIPLILVLMTVTGAVYPAIDLTAGERERGTLETLIAAPVPRLGLLMAKYVAVLTVALLTALVNLAGMTITAHSTGLAASLFGGGMTLDVVIKVLLLLALFAAFFSAILLALTSCARSFKEAQAYIIPLMLVCLVPGVLCLLPEPGVHRLDGRHAAGEHRDAGPRPVGRNASRRSLAVAAVCSTPSMSWPPSRWRPESSAPMPSSTAASRRGPIWCAARERRSRRPGCPPPCLPWR